MFKNWWRDLDWSLMIVFSVLVAYVVFIIVIIVLAARNDLESPMEEEIHEIHQVVKEIREGKFGKCEIICPEERDGKIRIQD